MAKDSLFKRLTKLFRSGPVVRRKVKALDTRIAVPDRYTNATALFQKSQSPIYSSIMASAHNTSERFMRYQDFQEMEMTPELASALDIYCLAGDNRVALLNGTKPTIKELYESQKENFEVYSFDIENNKFVHGNCLKVKKTGENQKIFKVILDDDKFVRLTENHLVLLSSGEYKAVKELTQGESIRSLYTSISSLSLKDRLEGYEKILDADGKWKYTHRIVAENASLCKQKGVVHHIDIDKRNNESKNLCFMDYFDHQRLHSSLNSERWKNNKQYAEKMKAAFSAHAKKMHSIPGWTDKFLEKRNEVFASYSQAERKEVFGRKGKQNGMYGQGNKLAGNKNGRWKNDYAREVSKEQIISWIDSGKTLKEICKNLPIRQGDLYSCMKKHGIKKWERKSILNSNEIIHSFRGWIKKQPAELNLKRCFLKACDELGISRYDAYLSLENLGYSNWSNFLNKTNHQVKSIQFDGIEDVYDLEVEKYHNFAICGNESDDSYIMVHNSDETVATDEKGRALHVYSEDEKVKSILDDLFYNTLNVEFNLRSWVRNLVKYGDFFAFIDVSPDHGIMNVIPIPVNEIEREEGYDRNDPLAVRFRWTQMGNRVLENWEVAHFRLLGNDMYLPYGSSVIDPARRIWRQLILIEDAMLTYRVSRAPERRVFYIDVGNIEPEAIPTYVEQQRQQLRTNPVVDKSTGRTDLRFNAMCLSLKNQVKLQDGRFITLGDFIKEWESGKTDQWVYSIDQETKAIVPGKVVWAGITRKDAELVRVTLDDGSYLDTTPDHRFMKRDGSYCEAKDLVANDALMPLYTKVSTKEDGYKILGYELLYNPFSEKYEFTHRVNANVELTEQRELTRSQTDWNKNRNLVVHHINFDSLDNSPQNLKWMGAQDHFAYHASIGRENIIVYNKSEKKRLRTSFLNKKYNSVAAMAGYNGSTLHKEHNSIRKAAQEADWSDPSKKAKRSAAMRWNITDEMFERIVSIVSENVTNSRGAINELLLADSEFRKGLEESKLGRDISKFSHAAWCGEIKRRGYTGLGDFKKSINAGYKNHKVVSVEFLSHREDTGCITVEKYHNFAAGGNDDCQSDKSSKSMILLHNSVDEDFFIPTRGGDSGTKIDTLPGGTNTAAVEDVAYIQKKMFAALKIPSAYLGYDEALSSKAGLAQLDIRFSRTISAIQRVVISELNKLAIIHLVANGYEGDELLNFVLKLSNPSTIAQQQKLELYRAKFEIAGSAPEGLVDRNYLRKNILGLTDDEIESIERGKSIDRASDMKLEQEAALNATPSGAGGGTGGDLFADTGGDTATGTEDDLDSETEPADAAAAADTEPPPENASEEPPEEEDPGIDLLSDADDPNSPAASLKLKPGQNPLKASSQLSKSLYNRGRRRTHGASKTHMPDLAKMTGNDTPESNDPHDMAWLKAVVSNPMGESQENRIKPKLTSDVKRMIANMGSQFGWSQPHSQVNNSLLTEETEIENNSNSTKGLEEFDVIITGEDDGDS